MGTLYISKKVNVMVLINKVDHALSKIGLSIIIIIIKSPPSHPLYLEYNTVSNNQLPKRLHFRLSEITKYIYLLADMCICLPMLCY